MPARAFLADVRRSAVATIRLMTAVCPGNRRSIALTALLRPIAHLSTRRIERLRGRGCCYGQDRVAPAHRSACRTRAPFQTDRGPHCHTTRAHVPEDFDWERYASAVPVGTPGFDDADGASALQHVLAATARLSGY